MKGHFRETYSALPTSICTYSFYTLNDSMEISVKSFSLQVFVDEKFQHNVNNLLENLVLKELTQLNLD